MVKWKEYIQDLQSAASFTALSFPVQPGIPTMFAWLAQQACFYQEYRFRKLRFCYETERSSATDGKVMFAFLPDASDGLPVSKQEMLENEWKASSAVWQAFELDVPMSALSGLGQKRYIRSGALAGNLDIKTYDVGQLIAAVQGMTDTSTLAGEIYVEYEVELMTPIMSSKQLSSILSKVVTGVTPSQTSLFGTTPTLTSGLDVTATVNTLTFNRVGNFIVVGTVTGTGLFTAFSPSTVASSSVNLSGITVLSGISNAAANVGTTAIFVISLNVLSRNGQGELATLVIDCSGISTTITASTTRIAGFVAAFP
jgi:hypothetical protein